MDTVIRWIIQPERKRSRSGPAEYEALIAGMRPAKEMQVKDLKAKSDSQLVTSQVSGEFRVKNPPTHQVSGIDLLSKLASTKKLGNNRTVIQETITKPSTGDPGIWMMVENEDWRTPIIQYLKSEKLPDEKEEAVRVKKMAAHYTMIGDMLYKR
ncbi:gag-pol polyprotein, partial [Trifolium medium]|nr:gag-pol polyprotein [Trifolium medium]